jgi:hypothetical protein
VYENHWVGLLVLREEMENGLCFWDGDDVRIMKIGRERMETVIFREEIEMFMEKFQFYYVNNLFRYASFVF